MLIRSHSTWAQLVCVRDGALDHEDYWKILVRSSIWVFIPYWTPFFPWETAQNMSGEG